MKIISWNVNGVRAVMKKDFMESFKSMGADILCLQETKAQDDQVAEALAEFNDYHIFSNSAVKKGYSGTAIISKEKPLNISKDMGIEEHDQEGRVLCAEYEQFFLVTVYVPNSGSALKRLDYRQQWDKDFYNYLKKLEETKPVLVCGDFNVAHTDIDLARPKPNYNKSAGYMQDEIDGMDRFTKGGLKDTFRHFYPELTDKYSWWSYRAGARGKNVGWRIDYFLASDSFIPQLKDAFIHHEIMGSDHCPVGIELK
ncbi:exodeoxyribonuclease III [Carboxylicivirga sp. M1479]|uniref:exodeoxyribonuclease III n=1 Tax=Carboxylicivirga sp. M1479 TaxID=2594476 RepID=UPI0011782654|nr:exodeoxyribonuclease III [Carboxylicivirga sp. M1479]TRX71467.1 exodeoxyribonuclease III [Carboxylicivirga sp. M1479]